VPPSQWTNASVLSFAAGADPVEVIIQKARDLVLRAMDAGWNGPPFEPLELARHLDIDAIPRDDIRDARTVPAGEKPRIEFNPSRPRTRMRYSIAHEIAHTLFPDCTTRIRNRARYHELSGDDWQLEALCNIAAAELVMPFASFPDLPDPVSIDDVRRIRATFDVSSESVVIRIVRMASRPYVAFCASRVEEGTAKGRYRLDYAIPSPFSDVQLGRGPYLPADTVLAECNAMGYTAKGDEVWPGAAKPLHIEAIAIAPYPGLSSPRVVGLARPSEPAAAAAPLLTYLVGDASDPRGTGERIVVQVVNDATPNWGGRGFANAILRKWPDAQTSFREFAARDQLRLGATHFYRPWESLTVASLVAQAGFGPSNRPRIRYEALEQALNAVAAYARERNATIHMPRIGSGQAGGRWEVVEMLVTEIFSSRGLQVTIYDLPEKRTATTLERQRSLLDL